jgi:acyl carrier protein
MMRPETTMEETMTSARDSSGAVSSITAALARVLTVDQGTLNENTRLFDDLGLDSTTVLELLMQLEEDLSIEFDSDNLEQHHFETVGTLAAFLTEQTQA